MSGIEQGQEIPHQKRGGSLFRKLVIAALVFGAAWYLVANYALPPSSCEDLVSGVVNSSKENAGDGPKIIDVVQVSQVQKSDKEMLCSGTAVLSNNMKQVISFRYYEEYEKWWVSFKPIGEATP